MKNGKTVLFDVKPYLKNNRMMVPLRFIAETFGCNVVIEISSNCRNQTISDRWCKGESNAKENYLTFGT